MGDGGVRGDGALRRTLLVLLAYAAGAWLVLLVGSWLRRVLSLPMLFEQLLHGGLLLGVVVAGILAWHYPRLATHEEPGARGGPDERAGHQRDREPSTRR